MLFNVTNIWSAVGTAAFDGAACFQGSTGQQSSLSGNATKPFNGTFPKPSTKPVTKSSTTVVGWNHSSDSKSSPTALVLSMYTDAAVANLSEVGLGLIAVGMGYDMAAQG